MRTLAGEGNGTPLQYSCLENPMDGGAWWAAVHGVAKSRTWLSDFTFTFHFQALEKEMATHSSVLAWRIQGTGEPYGLPAMGSHRVGHDWSDSAAAAAENSCIMKCNWQLLFRVHLKQRFYSTFTCCLQTRPSCKSAYQYIAEFCFSLKSIIYSLKQWVVRRIYSWL